MRRIRVLHLEPTDVCQAACPLCARETDINFDKRGRHHLTVDQIRQHFSDRVLGNLDKVFMCGNYGDPAAGYYTQDIYKWFRKLNPNIVLGMNSNGAVQNTFWWHALGQLFSQTQDYVVFSIDGLEDTNSVYRKNVDWQKLMANAEAYISAGGSAHWDMLVYRHNQHQVDACEKLARDLGFQWFRAKVSKRPFTDRLLAPVGWNLPAASQGKIACHALAEKSAYIDAQGRLSPCCWLGCTQQDFVTDIKDVELTWKINPHPICAAACTKNITGTNFTNQWQREINLV